METVIGKTKLRLVTGDIAEQDTEAVVTAAHYRLNKGMGTDGTIHSKGGPAIYEECQKIGGCPIGDAVITTGGNLRARYVMEVAVKNGLKSISIPSISTGAFCYPIRLAAPIAVKTVVDFLKNSAHELEEVRLVLYTREDEKACTLFADALQHLMFEQTGHEH